MPSGLQAHYLNMTRCTVTVDEVNRVATGDMEVDLTRYIGGGEKYHAITQLTGEEREANKAEIAAKIVENLDITFDGEPLDVSIDTFVLPGMPLEDFIRDLAAPMAEVTFSFAIPESEGMLKLATRPKFPFEYPFVYTVQSREGERRKTRWLAMLQASPEFEVLPRPVAIAEAPATAIATEESPPDDAVASQADPPAIAETAPMAEESEEEDIGDLLAAWWDKTAFGIGHIVPKGFDHILFVVGLFLLGSRPKELLGQVTCFTLAHSVTLGLAGVGLLVVSPLIVDPLVAFSIVYVGIENTFRDKLHKSRLIVVFLFGLLHGLSFATSLAGLDLTSGEFFPTLIAFNIGVEIGQIIVLIATFIAFGWLADWKHYRRRILIPASLVIAAIALIWTVERTLFAFSKL